MIKKSIFTTLTLVVFASVLTIKSAYAPGLVIAQHNILGNNTLIVQNTGGQPIWFVQIDVNGATIPLPGPGSPPGWNRIAFDGNLVRWQALTPQAAIQANQQEQFTILTVDGLGNPVCSYFVAWVTSSSTSNVLGSGWLGPIP